MFTLGTARLRHLARFLDPVEERLGQELNIVVHRPTQVSGGFARGMPFYGPVWEQVRRALVGELLQAPVDGSVESTSPG